MPPKSFDPDAKILTFKADAALVAALHERAAQDGGRSISSVIRSALSSYLSNDVSDFHDRGINVAGPR